MKQNIAAFLKVQKYHKPILLAFFIFLYAKRVREVIREPREISREKYYNE